MPAVREVQRLDDGCRRGVDGDDRAAAVRERMLRQHHARQGLGDQALRMGAEQPLVDFPVGGGGGAMERAGRLAELRFDGDGDADDASLAVGEFGHDGVAVGLAGEGCRLGEDGLQADGAGGRGRLDAGEEGRVELDARGGRAL